MFEYGINNGEVTITGYKDKTAQSIEFPEFIEGYPVTKICGNSFFMCHNLISISIPKSVKEMSANIFLWVNTLKYINDIEIDDYLKIIDDRFIYYFTSMLTIKYVINNDYAYNYGETSEISYLIGREFVRIYNNVTV